MMLCDGITRESEKKNPGSHALIWYLRATDDWFGCRGLSAEEGELAFTSWGRKQHPVCQCDKIIIIIILDKVFAYFIFGREP